MDWFLYDKGLRHERVNEPLQLCSQGGNWGQGAKLS